MLSPSIEKYLKNHNINYKTIAHPTAYTASQTAQSAHVAGKQLMKVVIVKLDGQMAMVAIPANKSLDFSSLEKITHAKNITLAHEQEFNQQFNDCEIGAMPPFGDLYGMKVFCAESFKHQKTLTFNAGTHTDLLELNAKDFLILVHPHWLPAC